MIINAKYLSLKEVALKLSVSKATIRRLMAKQKIPFTRATGVPRFPELVIEQWARTPERIVQEWFSGKEVESADLKNADSNKTRQIGRSLFLHGCKRQNA